MSRVNSFPLPSACCSALVLASICGEWEHQILGDSGREGARARDRSRGWAQVSHWAQAGLLCRVPSMGLRSLHYEACLPLSAQITEGDQPMTQRFSSSCVMISGSDEVRKRSQDLKFESGLKFRPAARHTWLHHSQARNLSSRQFCLSLPSVLPCLYTQTRARSCYFHNTCAFLTQSSFH